MLRFLAVAFLIAAFLLWEMRDFLFILLIVYVAAAVAGAVLSIFFKPRKEEP